MSFPTIVCPHCVPTLCVHIVRAQCVFTFFVHIVGPHFVHIVCSYCVSTFCAHIVRLQCPSPLCVHIVCPHCVFILCVHILCPHFVHIVCPHCVSILCVHIVCPHCVHIALLECLIKTKKIIFLTNFRLTKTFSVKAIKDEFNFANDKQLVCNATLRRVRIMFIPPRLVYQSHTILHLREGLYGDLISPATI